EPLSQALKAFAAQSHMELLFQSADLAGKTGRAVSGDLDTHAALEELLRDAGLEVVYASPTAATIRMPASAVPVQFQIPAGKLAAALAAFQQQSGLRVSYAASLVRGKSTAGISGSYAPTEALRALLAGTGITFTAAGASTVVLKAVPAPTTAIGPSEGSE